MRLIAILCLTAMHGFATAARPPHPPVPPLRFEANRGQWPGDVAMIGRGTGYTLALRPQGMTMTTPRGILRMRWAADGHAHAVRGLGPLPGVSNEYIGNDPAKWRQGLRTWSKALVQSIEPGVDLVVYAHARASGTGQRPAGARLEFDLRVHSGASIAPVRLWFPGSRLRLDGHGGLRLTAEGERAYLGPPVAWQIAAGQRLPVECRYRLAGNQAIGFACPHRDRRRALVIDPVVALARYVGGSGSDQGAAVATDAKGDIYLAGATASPDLLPTGSYGGLTDAYVIEFDPSGATVLAAAYLGGASEDDATGLALGPDGSIYLTGATLSWNFPVTPGAYEPTQCGNYDAFVAHLSADGSQLLYSTYLGGTKVDWSNAIAVDGKGNAIIAGYTLSDDFPAVHAAQGKFAGGARDAFVASLSPDGKQLNFSTWLGGSGDDVAFAVGVDGSGDVLVGGSTTSADFPVTKGSFQTTFAGGNCGGAPCAAGFLAQLSPDGATVNWASYLGGAGSTAVYAITLSGAGQLWTAGATTVANLPFPAGGLQPAAKALGCGTNLCRHGYVAEWKPDGSGLVAGTYLAGSGDDAMTGLAFNAVNGGTVYVAGQTTSPDYPVTPSAPQGTLTGSEAAVVTLLDGKLQQLRFSTFWNGSASTQARALAVTDDGRAVIAGTTNSPDLPRTVPGTPAGYQGSGDAFLAEFNLGPVVQAQPAMLTFGAQQVGTASAAQTVAVTNIGTALLHLASVQAQGDYTVSSACGATIEPLQSCTVQVVFQPVQRGERDGALVFTDDAGGSPQSMALTGKGAAPVAQVTPATLTFPSQNVATTSAPQLITLNNTGDAPLTVTGITWSGDFTGTGNCGASVPAAGSCTMAVTFTPTASGARSGSMAVADHAGGSPQTVVLNGTGADFTLTGTPESAPVNPGQTAQFTLRLTPVGGFQQAVSLGCSGAPPEATCQIGSASVTPDGSHAASDTVTITTTAASLALPLSGPTSGRPTRILFLLLAGVSLAGLVAMGERRRRQMMLCGAALGWLLVVLAGCGGGGAAASSAGPTHPGTSPGVYTLTVTATSGNLQHTAKLTLQVQ